MDEKGRLLIPQSFRESAGIIAGTVVQMKQRGRIVEVIPTSKKRNNARSWREFYGIKPKRTGKPSWPSPEEIKSIWE